MKGGNWEATTALLNYLTLKLTYKEPYAVAEGFKIPQVFVL
jgi:hypothetical protein